MCGEYNLVVTRPDGSSYETGWFKNLILNSGFDRMMSPSVGYLCIQYASVGSGNSAPAASQTQLDAKVGATSNQVSYPTAVNLGTPTFVSSFSYSYVFTQGAVVGTIAEVGTGWLSAGPGSLFSRALILDGGGSPTTLTLTSIDQLTVYYKVTVTPTVTDASGSVTINGTAVNYTVRLSNASIFFGTDQYLGYNTGNPFTGRIVAPYPNIYTYGGTVTHGTLTSTSMNATTSLYQQPTLLSSAYVSGSLSQDTTWTWGPTLANHTGGSLSGIGLNWGPGINYNILFATPILKTATKSFSIVTRLTWSR